MARCDENARKGTGYGVCDARLDGHGQCPNASHHVPTDEIPGRVDVPGRVDPCGNTEPHESHEWYGKPAIFCRTCPGVETADPAARLVERVRQVRRLIQDAEAEVWDRPPAKTRERRQFIAQQRAGLQALEECAEIFGVQLPAWDAVALDVRS